jgi:predicted nucleic acid-binding protein
MRYALDADVLIGALDSTDLHHRAARQHFKAWHARKDSVSISVVNLSEVLVAPARDPHRLRVARAAVAALGVEIHQPSEPIGVEAARLRARHPISLPDAYLIATARQIGATAASFDRKVLRAAQAERVQTTATS